MRFADSPPPRRPTDKTAVQRQIDQLAHILYALTYDEVAIVEESHGL